ncbi:hypothetical protein [Leptolyngbya sp. Cla-17]|nr:hypothetical protein [Leptolyngbya sp. Cla-17]
MEEPSLLDPKDRKEKPESDEYAAYLTEYYSVWLENYEMTQQAC